MMIIKDNTPRLRSEFSDIYHLAERIADKTLGQLEKEGITGLEMLWAFLAMGMKD